MKSINFLIVNESIQRMIGTITKDLIKSMYGVDFRFDVDLANLSQLIEQEAMSGEKFSIKGKPEQVESYVRVVARTKFYLDAIMEFDKKHPMTAKRRAELDQAVSEFESATGVTWPFKHEG